MTTKAVNSLFCFYTEMIHAMVSPHYRQLYPLGTTFIKLHPCISVDICWEDGRRLLRKGRHKLLTLYLAGFKWRNQPKLMRPTAINSVMMRATQEKMKTRLKPSEGIEKKKDFKHHMVECQHTGEKGGWGVLRQAQGPQWFHIIYNRILHSRQKW